MNKSTFCEAYQYQVIPTKVGHILASECRHSTWKDSIKRIFSDCIGNISTAMVKEMFDCDLILGEMTSTGHYGTTQYRYYFQYNENTYQLIHTSEFESCSYSKVTLALDGLDIVETAPQTFYACEK